MLHLLENKGANITIFSCHAPNEEKDEEIKDIFYDELKQAYNAIPRHAIKITMGDMNAKIGPENV